MSEQEGKVLLQLSSSCLCAVPSHLVWMPHMTRQRQLTSLTSADSCCLQYRARASKATLFERFPPPASEWCQS